MLWTDFTSSVTVSACRQDQSAGYPHQSGCYNIRRPLTKLPMSIAELVHILHANERITVRVPPKTFVLGLIPFRMITETDAVWVDAAFSAWDDTVEMSRLCLDHAQCTKYLVKAVVYHVHPLEGPANLQYGHYITYFKHGHRWHLANGSQVDIVLMAGLRGLPHIVVMERINALEEDVVAIHDEG